MRGRSSSANEASKPILMLQRRQTHVGTKTCGFSPVGGKYIPLCKTVEIIKLNKVEKSIVLGVLQFFVLFEFSSVAIAHIRSILDLA